MSILVTGGGGLLGSHIVRKLISRGNTVVSLDTNTEQGRLADLSNSSKLKLISCDVRELENFSAQLKSYQIERVIHLAAVLAPISEEKPSHGFSINIQGTANVFEASSRAKIKRVIYASSIAVFGDQTEYGSHSEVDENSLRNPYS
ncbi:MAG: SDR family NAD(P)-dependent oxidoreductase, partial [Rhodospirillales bacterium]